MKSHLRSHLLLLAFTVVLCCGLYPAVMLALGQTLVPATASGSLIEAKGSRLIAQPFTNDEYFWPRPSAASYNGAASSGSNLGASNPKLRDRVAQQLGPIVVYKAGSKSSARTPQEDIAAWFAALSEKPDPLPEPALIPALFFDRWLSDPANKDKAADLEPVIADMVTASGSGLDPHITLRNALSVYQLDRVAKTRATSPAESDSVKKAIAELARSQAFAPLSGLVGEPLVNVLELNLAVDAKFPFKPAAK